VLKISHRVKVKDHKDDEKLRNSQDWKKQKSKIAGRIVNSGYQISPLAHVNVAASNALWALYAFCYGYAFAIRHAVNFLSKWVKTLVSALTAREETNGISYNIHSKRRTQGHVDGRPTYGYAQSLVCLVCDLKYDLIKRRCLQLLFNKNDEGLEGSMDCIVGLCAGRVEDDCSQTVDATVGTLRQPSQEQDLGQKHLMHPPEPACLPENQPENPLENPSFSSADPVSSNRFSSINTCLPTSSSTAPLSLPLHLRIISSSDKHC
ncbi:hypothetical protein Tco_0345749, partial [Tanacetum coccineum]